MKFIKRAWNKVSYFLTLKRIDKIEQILNRSDLEAIKKDWETVGDALAEIMGVTRDEPRKF